MDKEAFIETIVDHMWDQNEIDKEYILEYLVKNYQSENYIPEGFDKIAEMGQILTLSEKIQIAERDATDYLEYVKARFDSVKAVVYSIALINSRKCKIDIFKVKDEFGIDDLINKYMTKEENDNED